MPTALLRIMGPTLFLIHFCLNIAPASKGTWSEIYLYNSIALCAIAMVLTAPHVSDPYAQPLITTAFGLWLLGSIFSSITAYYSVKLPSQILSNAAYLLFYPFAILGLPRIISPSRKFSILEIFDASIVGLGLSTLGTALFLKPVLPHFDGNLSQTFFAIVFPVADLIVLSITLAAVLTRAKSWRSILLTAGILIFTFTDFLFLTMHINGKYSFGSLIDDGWVLGLLLIASSFWFQESQSLETQSASPILITLSVFLSATLLALIAIHPGYFPSFVLIPAISTLIFAFIRMALALKAARNIGTERILARTDELTGLPNRRKLISEIENFISKEGCLLLMDLDGFKPVNDRYGHATGDRVLQQVAMRFSRALPSGALLARLGGDEFGVLFEGGYESAMEIALALRATLSYPFIIENESIQIGVSIGVAPNNGTPDLLRRADDAMYRAKREGLGVCRL